MLSRYSKRERERGVTLLEVMTAATLSATMMMSSFVVLRSSYTAWVAHEADLDRTGNAMAVLRHLVQNIRQCVSVADITAATEGSGSLTIVMADGEHRQWSCSSGAVTLSIDGASAQPLANDIASLNFVGYEADGVTPSTDPSSIQAIRAVVTTQQPAGGTRTVSSYTWVRSW